MLPMEQFQPLLMYGTSSSQFTSGKIGKVKDMVEVQPELLYAWYNYTRPIDFAVREGDIKLVEYSY